CGTETLGIDREELIDQLLAGTAKYSSIFNYPTLNWADIGCIGWFVDGAAIVNQTMFGPHDSASPNSDELLRWGVKKKGNDELRQRFVNLTVAQAKAIDLTLPDPALRYDEASGNWLNGPIDWDEFWRVVKGDGPCNRERLAARREAHADGEWVRVAAAAHAAKQQRPADAS